MLRVAVAAAVWGSHMKRTICLIFSALLLAAFIAACGGGGGSGASYPAPSAQSPCNASTSFEFDATGPFCVGTSPYTATFSSGVTKASGRSDYYSSGDYAWHVLNETSATVTFETLPSTLTFYVRGEIASTVSDIQILDENGDLILQMAPTNILQQVIVNRTVGQTIIGSVVVTSTSGGDVVIDDCIFLIA